MATLVFGSLGSMLGGPLGGAIGSLVGRQFDAALFGSTGRQGPRLKELAVTTSSYGQTLPRHFGRMRTAGSVIWATNLVERSEAQGSGKGGPSLTTYAYSVSFAVALASRPIRAIGRIWADGKLLRGAAGDLKAAGTLRVHTGAGDQQADPLIVAAEGPGQCPGYRDLAYVVFEDLDLSGFYNRIPSLTFEVIADDGFSLQNMIGEVVEDVDADIPFPGLSGYTSEGSPAADLQVFDQITPLEIDAAGEHLVIAAERRQEAAIRLPEPAVATGDGDFGARTGFTRHRAPPPESPPSILRYYDVERDHQPTLQRATGRSIPGEPAAIDLPAALDAATARALIERTARRIDWSRDRVSWRTCELDPRIGPGALVTLPGIDGHWRVREWEWRDSGVELHLERALPPKVATTPDLPSDPGRPNPPLDTETGQTRLVAFELPFNAATGLPDAPRPFAAVSATSPGWSGAALYADHGNGALHPLGPSGRTRATIGTVASPLPPASPLLFDRTSRPIITLVDPGMQLAATDAAGISRGANLALIGEEIVQFLGAVPIGAGRWRLEGLLRGRAGTEAAIAAHTANEDFVLLDNSLVRLDASTLGSLPGRQIVALGRGDGAPVAASLHLDGIAQRPLAPVRPRMIVTKDGGLLLSWTRRARGGWAWQDGVDVPLVEQAERYLVTLGPLDTPLTMWTSTSPKLEIDAATVARFATSAPHAAIHVRQQGTHALSLPLLLGTLS